MTRTRLHRVRYQTCALLISRTTLMDGSMSLYNSRHLWMELVVRIMMTIKWNYSWEWFIDKVSQDKRVLCFSVGLQVTFEPGPWLFSRFPVHHLEVQRGLVFGTDREPELCGAWGLRDGELLPCQHQLALPQHVLQAEGNFRTVQLRLWMRQQPLLLVLFTWWPHQRRQKMSAYVQPDQRDHVRVEAGEQLWHLEDPLCWLRNQRQILLEWTCLPSKR